ncbi:hypothetical protein JTB14_025958 [Gonioctena quinquepunctata]|nr:hypothetical protein JTB14_025958 [Gonioctena quinquepunctata]
MASNNYLANVPKLQGRENYEEWSFAMENFLVLEGLSKCIDGTETENELVAKAKAKVVLSLNPSLYVHVKEATTAKEVWDTLKDLYENKGFTRKISLLRNLISLRLENCSSMAEYVNQVIETSQKLSRTGLKLDTSLVGSLLLAGLPDRFAPMVIALEHSGIGITTDTIKSKLLDMQLDGGTNSTGGAFAIKVGNQKYKSHNRNKNDSRNKNKDDIICYRCKQPGHFMSKCPQFNQNKGTDKQTKGAFNVVFLSTNFNNNDWYLDSGASVHLTCRQDWLLNQREPIVKDIMIANNSKITVKSSGEVDILTKVGKENFEIEIQNAQYVPELATNLFCRIFNNDKVLVAKAFLSDGVYKIDTSKKCLLAGQAGTTGETWHRRLGHINSSFLNEMRDGLISTSRDVHIIEKERNADSVHFFVEENTEGNDPNNYQEVYSNEDSSSESPLEQTSGELVFSEEELSDETYVPEDEESLVVPENVRRSQRERKTKNFEDFVTYFTPVKQANYEENPVSVGDPNSVAEALAGPNRNKWISAMTDEMKSFSENRAWDLVDLPEGQSPVKCKWVFKEKEAEIQTIASLNDIEIVYADDPEEQNVEDNFVEEEEISNEISSPHKSKGATPVLRCRNARTTHNQYEEFLSFIEEGNKTVLFEDKKQTKELWDELGVRLNNIGPSKKVTQWKKVNVLSILLKLFFKIFGYN